MATFTNMSESDLILSKKFTVCPTHVEIDINKRIYKMGPHLRCIAFGNGDVELISENNPVDAESNDMNDSNDVLLSVTFDDSCSPPLATFTFKQDIGHLIAHLPAGHELLVEVNVMKDDVTVLVKRVPEHAGIGDGHTEGSSVPGDVRLPSATTDPTYGVLNMGRKHEIAIDWKTFQDQLSS
ncbi:unnamed protein product [Peniophora sp. CBMAI 1063]|nr:unnamed protein product [Peniophora sp. CBMAI 1063]